MKFLHLGDLHIGKTLGDFDLYEDQKYILEKLVELAKEKAVDAVLIAGDVYDKAIPSEAAVRLFDHFIRSLVENNFKTFLISGNHDSDERLNFGSALFESNQIYIAAKNESTIKKYRLEDSQGELFVYLMPYVKASQVKRFYPEAEIQTYDDAVRVLLKNSDIDVTKRNVLVAHQFVTASSSEPQLGGSEGMAVKNVGTIEKIGADCFDAFEYVALGHIHSGQRVGREEVRYAGSPLKYSLSEAGNEKTVPIVTIGEKGKTDIELVKLTPKRNLRHIKGKMEKLLAKENVTAPEDFIYATLTDEDLIIDAMGIFQQIYPNTVKIDYNNSRTKEVEQIDITEFTQARSFKELTFEFYHQMYGCEMSEEEWEVLKEVAREAGVSDEAD